MAFEAKLLRTAAFPLLVQQVLHRGLVFIILEEESIFAIRLSWLQIGIVVETGLLHVAIELLLQLGRLLSHILLFFLSRKRIGICDLGGLYLGMLAGGFFCGLGAIADVNMLAVGLLYKAGKHVVVVRVGEVVKNLLVEPVLPPFPLDEHD